MTVCSSYLSTQISGPLSQKLIKTPGLWVYLSLTWCNGSWYRSALHIILNRNNTDVVLHSWTEVLQGAGVLPRLHKLLHTVSLLPIGGSASHSVASDVLEGEILEKEKEVQCLHGVGNERKKQESMYQWGTIRCWEKMAKQNDTNIWVCRCVYLVYWPRSIGLWALRCLG